MEKIQNQNTFRYIADNPSTKSSQTIKGEWE